MKENIDKQLLCTVCGQTYCLTDILFTFNEMLKASGNWNLILKTASCMFFTLVKMKKSQSNWKA